MSFLEVLPTNFFIDLYDLGKSILEFDWTWGGLADIGLNVVGLIPGVGDLAKASRLGKNAINTVDAVADVTDGLNDARKAIKRTDALVDASKAAKNVGNTADALDTANDASKGLKNVDSPTGGQNSFKSIKNRFPNEVQQGRLYEHKLQDGKIIKIQTGYREFDFVVTQNNELRIGSEHSFLANGEDVYAAGKMKVSSSGQITKVTNQSGHYTPTVEDRMSQFNDALKSSGVRTERAWMELYKFDMTNSGYVIGGGVREKMIKMK